MQTANILGEINLDPLDNVNSFEIETIEKLKFPKITSIDKRLKIQKEITIEYLAVHKSIIEKKKPSFHLENRVIEIETISKRCRTIWIPIQKSVHEIIQANEKRERTKGTNKVKNQKRNRRQP